MGRMIDADKLIESFKNLEMSPDPKNPASGYSMQEAAYKQGIMKALNEIAPKIIADKPTDFDKEKVILTLEKYAKHSDDDCDIDRSFEQGIEAAIKEIEKGGADADH